MNDNRRVIVWVVFVILVFAWIGSDTKRLQKASARLTRALHRNADEQEGIRAEMETLVSLEQEQRRARNLTRHGVADDVWDALMHDPGPSYR